MLVPALVIATSAALGGLLARVTATNLGALKVPAGFLAGMALISLLLTLGLSGALSVALTAALGIAGAVLAARDVRRAGRLPRLGPALLWPAAAFVAAYAIALAPIVGSGRSGMLGYAMYDDPAIHITHVEQLAQSDAREHRPLEDSFHTATRDLEAGYPLGGYAWPLFGRVTTGVEPFHLWVSLSAVVLALIALVAYAMLRALGMPRALAAAAGALVGVGHLVYAYHAQGGSKEVLLPLTVYGTIALVARALARPMGRRSLIPAAVGGAAAIANLSHPALAWIGPVALFLAVIVGRRAWQARSSRVLAPLAGALALSVAVDVPLAIRSFGYVESNQGITDQGVVGNLLGPVPFREAFNVWLAHDYRLPVPDSVLMTDIGVALAVVLSVVGGVWAVRRRDVGIPLSLAAGFVAIAIITPPSSIYYDAKTYVAIAPALGLATAAGLMALTRRRTVVRVASLVAAGLLAAGVLASDAYVYSGVWVTPRYRFDELAQAAGALHGRGPVLVDDTEDWAFYILRDAKPWVEGSFRSPYRSLRGPIPTSRLLDFDDYPLRHIERFPFLLERKGPFNSRPPANYVSERETRNYRTWRRSGPGPRLHVPLGSDGFLGQAALRCRRGVPVDSASRVLFARARALGVPVRAALAPPAPVLVVAPTSWVEYRADPLSEPAGYVSVIDSSASSTADLPPGRYFAWVRGSMGPGLALYARPRSDPRFTRAGVTPDDLSVPPSWHPLGVVAIAGSTDLHVALTPLPWYRTASRRRHLVGPIVFTAAGTQGRIVDVPFGSAASLCGRSLDWLEIPPA